VAKPEGPALVITAQLTAEVQLRTVAIARVSRQNIAAQHMPLGSGEMLCAPFSMILDYATKTLQGQISVHGAFKASGGGARTRSGRCVGRPQRCRNAVTRG
jgi:hypothetical protein